LGWMQKLAETYDNCSSQIGILVDDEDGKNKVPLLPIAHTTQNMQIEITIDIDGNFISARLVPTNDASTIIPCTEGSSGRTSGLQPHPLCDSLQYIAADYKQFGGRKRQGFELYKQQLQDWCESQYAHPHAVAIYNYISKGHVVGDLVKYGVLQVDDEGRLLDKWDRKIYPEAPNRKQDESFVRFVVWEPGNPHSKTWDNPDLYAKWQAYNGANNSHTDLCYVLGEIKPVAEQHPRFIRSSGDGAKIISSNDLAGFTFRGRFFNASEACSISFEVSQKAHYALKWLISRQGRVFLEKGGPGLTVVAWATSGAFVPNPTGDTVDVTDIDDLPDDENIQVYTAQDDALKLNKKIAGYKAYLGDMAADVVVMALNSATTGRMAISFYREMKGSDFADRLEHWHSTCCWDQQYWDFGKLKMFIGAPAPRIIAECAYGSKVDEKLLKKTVERLLPCIVDGHKIPWDIMESAVRRACNRVGIKSEWEWETTLGTACALYRKHQIDYKGEDIGMGLDHNRKTRDYLYGRLLAIADVFEQRALSKAERNRPTNAARYMQRFAERPASTWRYIELALEPYMARLSPGTNYFYKKYLDEVMDKFDPKDFIDDKKLSGEFLLGYHCQRKELIPSTKNEKTPINVEEMEGE